MSETSLPKQRCWHDLRNFAGTPLLLLLLLICFAAPGRGIDIGGVSVWLAVVIPLVIAAIGQTQIVLAGGQGLAAGSTALLVNALVTTQMVDTTGSIIAWPLVGILVGAVIGGSNGMLIGFLRLPSTAVTLATSFIVGGVTLGLTDSYPAAASERFRELIPAELLGIPAPIVVIAALLATSLVLDRSAVGRGIRSAGRGGWRAVDRRNQAWVALAYLVAGIGYGISGVFVAAEIGTTDPTTSSLSLLEIYAAVGLGGSVPYVRQGSSLGAAVGALVVGALTYAAALFSLPDYAAPTVIAVLLLAVLWRAGAGLPKSVVTEPPVAPAVRYPIACFGLPLVVVLLIATGYGGSLIRIDPLILTVAGMLALAQASVVLTGHLDLSLPATTAFAGLACVALSQGSDAALVWVVPFVLGIGTAIGVANGALGLVLKGPRVLVTLAAMGLLNAAGISIALAWPYGFAPPALMRFMDPTASGPAPALFALGAVLAVGLAVFATPPVRRWLRELAGAPEPLSARRAAPLVHGVAGLLAAAVGIVLAGYGGASPISGGDPFTLPSLLAVEAAGLTVGRRGGAPWMLVLSVPMVLAIDLLMVAFGASYPARVVVMGALLLVSIVIRGLVPLLRRAPPDPAKPEKTIERAAERGGMSG